MTNRHYVCLDSVLCTPHINVAIDDDGKPVLRTDNPHSVKRYVSKLYSGWEDDDTTRLLKRQTYQNLMEIGGAPLKLNKFTRRHKYGQDRAYLGYQVYDKRTGKAHPLLESALVWMYHHPKELIMAGEDIDHIDGNPLNNDISNLQKITRKENIAKRGGAKNQFYYIGKGEKN